MTVFISITLIESIHKSDVNKSSIPRPTTEPQQVQPMPTLNPQTQHEYQNNHQPLRYL